MRAAEIGTPVLLLTARDQIEDRVEGLDAGAVEVTTQTMGGTVEAIVRDAEPGIPPEHLSHVFDRFYRADAQSAARTRGEAGGGTGLGLTIARDLARAQGGDLTTDNAKTTTTGEASNGASFTLRLPAGP